jgi:hypothetical protein
MQVERFTADTQAEQSAADSVVAALTSQAAAVAVASTAEAASTAAVDTGKSSRQRKTS